MPSFDSANLLNKLKNEVVKIIAASETLQQLDNAQLNQQPAIGKWSAAQVVEHLNTYNDYYLPQLKKALIGSRYAAKPVFKSGMLGEYFTNSMLPKADGQLKSKMKAFKAHVPAALLDGVAVLNKFITDQKKLLNLLDLAIQKDIGKIRVPISISKWINLKAGDTLRFLIAHQQRHFLQIKNTLNAMNVHIEKAFLKS